MKIAIVHPTFYVKGGAENVVIWLAAELLRRGHRVTIFTSEYDRRDPDIPDAVKECMEEIAAGGIFSTWLDWRRAGRRLAKRLQAFDVVNPHNFPANVWVYFARRRCRRFPPVVWYCQEPSRLLYPQVMGAGAASRTRRSGDQRLAAKIRRDRWRVAGKLLQKSRYHLLMLLFREAVLGRHRDLDRKAGAACDLILGNSRYMTERIRRVYNGRGETCRLGVPAPAAVAAESEKKKDFFLAVSRLEPLKRVEEIVRALHVLVHEKGERGASLVVVGTGSQEQPLRELVGRLKLEGHVAFAGYAAAADLERRYREALAVIYVPEDEAFGLVPLEAMLRGTVVIVAREGGMAETVVDGVTGLLVEPRRSEQLVAAMGALLGDRERAWAMGERGRRHVMSEFTFPRFVDRFLEFIEQVRRQETGKVRS